MDKQKKEQEGFFVLQSHWHYHLIILATGFLIFVFVPLFILKPEQSKQIFNNGREAQVAFDILILVGVFSVASSLIYWIFTALNRREIAASLLRFLFCWVALSGFLFPLTTNHGMFEIMSSPLHKANFFLVLTLALLLAVFWGSKYVKTVTVFLAIFLTVAILPTIPRAISQFEKQTGEAHQLNLSPENNLLLVGMDGVPSHIIEDILRDTEAIQSAYKDFTFYRNVTATSPATVASLMGITYGNHNFKKWAEPYPIKWRELYFNNAEEFNLYTLDKFNTYNETGTKLSAGRYGVAEQRNELFELFRNVAVRLFSRPGVNLMVNVDEGFFPNRKGKFYWTTEGFDTIVESLSVGSDRPTILFSHFAFTHWPTSIDENCDNRKSDAKWMAENSNKEGIEKGTICAVDKYIKLLDKLKALGVYDNTTIVFFSDHGKPVLYYDEPPHNLEINDNRDFGFDRYRPFLMIKPAQSQQTEMAIDDKILILDDLAQTNCYLMQPSPNCEQMPGVNILDENDISPNDFYIHVVQDAESGWFLEDHKAVQLSRKIPLEDAMRESGEIQLKEKLP